MAMFKNSALFLIVLYYGIAASCSSGQKEFTLLGKWQHVSSTGSDGANTSTNKVQNGKILIFEKGNVVKDGAGNKGTYRHHGDSLHLVLPDHEEFYLLYRDRDNFDHISLNPVSNKYGLICDEGCADNYERLGNSK
jgi:hypothetical protein